MLFQVSWIRSRDLTILTIGTVRYTRDPRFTAIHGQGTENWGLKVTRIPQSYSFNWTWFQIVNPGLDDSGLYECQVSYHDDTEKKLKMPFNLQVLGEFYSLNFSARLQSLLSEDGELSELTISESRAYIVGSHDLYMKEASEVELRCKIEESPGPPAYIYWYKVRIFVVKKK